MKAPSPLAVRTFVLTAAVTTITIGGTLFGAELKSKQEARQVAERREQATVDEKLETLRGMRADLVSKKLMVEKQLQDLGARTEEKKQKGLGSAATPSLPGRDEVRKSSGG